MLNDLTSSKARPKGSKNNSLNGSQEMGNSLKQKRKEPMK